MTALLITPEIREAIKAAIERARAKTIAWEKLRDYVLEGNREEVKLGDRKPGFERVESEHVLIPTGYRASLSFEEQPAGICRHLSISVPTPGNLPNAPAIEMIAKEFGFNWPPHGRVWIEEFRPGHEAVHLIEIAVEHPGSDSKQ